MFNGRKRNEEISKSFLHEKMDRVLAPPFLE
jgi:hypothetical protein